MYNISKTFDFCYGHRVYTQNVNPKYALSDACPCTRIHGHQGNVTVNLSSWQVDDRGFVIDFKELSFIKQFINDNLDHRFILSTRDPRFENLTGCSVEQMRKECEPVHLLDGVIMGSRVKNIELDSFFYVDFNPTSEELAKWIFDGVSKVIELSDFNCKVDSVVWSETPKTQAIYS